MKLIGIYKITSPSGRIYIGQTRNFKSRCSDYKSLDSIIKQRRLYNSFIKYGAENHKIEFIEECLFENLNIYERKWQDYYEVITNKGLNCILTETDKLPRVVSEETRLKISKSNTGKIRTQEYKDNLSKVKKGVKLSEEHKLKISEALLNNDYVISEETKKKIGLGNKGKKHTIEQNINNGLLKNKKVINTETGEIFESATKCAEYYGYNKFTLTKWLNGHGKNKTSLRYL